jgi:hypothetical protein
MKSRGSAFRVAYQQPQHARLDAVPREAEKALHAAAAHRRVDEEARKGARLWARLGATWQRG